jgi:hypothetical protein
VGPGDIVIIPPGVLHAFSQITDHVTYLSVRPDPDRVLPGGYVNPLLVKNGLTSVKSVPEKHKKKEGFRKCEKAPQLQ